MNERKMRKIEWNWLLFIKIYIYFLMINASECIDIILKNVCAVFLICPVHCWSCCIPILFIYAFWTPENERKKTEKRVRERERDNNWENLLKWKSIAVGNWKLCSVRFCSCCSKLRNWIIWWVCAFSFDCCSYFNFPYLLDGKHFSN